MSIETSVLSPEYVVLPSDPAEAELIVAIRFANWLEPSHAMPGFDMPGYIAGEMLSGCIEQESDTIRAAMTDPNVLYESVYARTPEGDAGELVGFMHATRPGVGNRELLSSAHCTSSGPIGAMAWGPGGWTGLRPGLLSTETG